MKSPSPPGLLSDWCHGHRLLHQQIFFKKYLVFQGAMEGEGDHVRERKYGKTWSPCRNEKIQDLRAELCDLALAARCEKNVLRRL